MKFLGVITMLVCLTGNGAAQTEDAPYLIPQTVFVGDEGRLVVPLGSSYAGFKPEVLEGGALAAVFPELQSDAALRRDMTVTRVELENRGSPRLLIDFKAYTPGILRFPPVMIGSSPISGLEVTIASILDAGDDSRILSPPASPLAAPGTMGLIYGSVALILLLLLGVAGGGIWGIPGLRAYRERLIRLRRMRRIGKIRRGILAGLTGNVSGGEEEALARFSAEFRDFLVFFTGMNCRAMVPAEFLHLPALSEEGADPLTGRFLCELFRRWDTLRFRGGAIVRESALELFEEVRIFIEALERAEREAPLGRRYEHRV
ncbi:MAG: hypothetical protein LBG76_03330 [Treponema sp.]|nr:hypothetical protein [Treponema sp.]